MRQADRTVGDHTLTRVRAVTEAVGQQLVPCSWPCAAPSTSGVMENALWTFAVMGMTKCVASPTPAGEGTPQGHRQHLCAAGRLSRSHVTESRAPAVAGQTVHPLLSGCMCPGVATKRTYSAFGAPPSFPGRQPLPLLVVSRAVTLLAPPPPPPPPQQQQPVSRTTDRGVVKQDKSSRDSFEGLH